MKSGRNWGRLGMKSNWKTCQLDELVTFTSGGTPSKKKAEYWNGSIPWISAKTMKDEHISTSDLMISEEGLKNGSRLAPQGSILFLIRGSGLFNGIPICLVDKPVAFNQDVKCINSISEIENKYVFYWLLSQASTLSAIVGVTTIGAGKFDMDVIKRLEISYPEKEVRNEIIRIADAISDKIRLNTAINENLEQQAQAIFSNLFPKCMSNGIAMSNIIDVRDGTHDSPKAKKEGYSLITSKHLQAYSVNKKEANLISYEDFNKINERSKVEYGDILISMIGTVGIISFISDKSIDFAIKNVGLFRTSQSAKLRFYVLNYLKTNEVANYIEQHLAGSTQKYISLTELRNLPIRIPSDEDLQEYNELISPIYGQIITLSKENQWLTELRDTLLPKLMNGEIDVSEVKI